MLSGGGRGSWALDEEGGIIKALEHENSEKEEGSWLEGGRKKNFFLGISGRKRLGQIVDVLSEI